MDLWIPYNSCTGCGACSNVCPKKAIILEEDECGFPHPIIDNGLCINCELCKKTCPVYEKPKIVRSSEPIVFAAWSKDQEIRLNSTSGGAFSEIAKQVLLEGGCVCGASYNFDNMVEHVLINDIEDLQLIRQSKYVQSDTKEVYKEIKKRLANERKIAFCGSPCQVSALLKYIGGDTDNLLTIEFICRGVNSPKAYRSWLREIENKNKKQATRVWFKYKVNGWNKSPRCTRVDFSDGTQQVYFENENTFMTGYLGPNLYIRPSCSECKFNGMPRQGDITLADFWGIQKELDDDSGVSLILINSVKGQVWYEKIRDNLVSHKRSFEEIHAGNVCFSKSVDLNPKSEEFLKSLTDTNFSIQIKKYTKESLILKIYKRTKSIFKICYRKIFN